MTRAPRAHVVGAGVIGLTTAMALRADGWDVELTAAEPPGATTSAVAAAVWYPYLVGPADAVTRWGLVSAQQLATLAGIEGMPVATRTVHEVFRAADVAPDWRREMQDARRIEQLPDGMRDGWAYTSWVADMPPYLAWLVEEVLAEGVTMSLGRFATLDEAWRPGVDLVVDCAGIGARTLADDPTLEPVAGQVVVVRAPGVTDVWLAPDGPAGATYVIPRTDTVVLGGTAERGLDDRRPVDATTEDILTRCIELVPALADCEVLSVAVGLRPSRPSVRLELDSLAECLVLHHYGHGGAGLTLSWGSALEAAQLARNVRL